ncbi:MAG: hypothetical protein IKO98_09210 [Bacteroidales bacterium]|nr:hypothetical protein [Bacteroidales bacterium]
MMEKKLTAATERVAEGNLRNERQYLPPVMEFTSFTLEKGFAVSQVDYQTDTDALDYYNVWDDPTGTDGNGELFF